MVINKKSEKDKLDKQMAFVKSQITGWENFRKQVKDPNNLLTAEKEINYNRKLLIKLQENYQKFITDNHNE
ncbi:hypothetical protein VB796_08820 [Arcicella sp. LKC2W]|uniref:hypothetical protein n=1 Tax=Arcicella sp. LKC2W TaxID=2984198 RepID=UPI002B207B6D|nr:hypothetical protein [Arcicella sp. LKC2W]MEA5459137.1 hypothetical protein [Arcicella sp. LKC2W]